MSLTEVTAMDAYEGLPEGDYAGTIKTAILTTARTGRQTLNIEINTSDGVEPVRILDGVESSKRNLGKILGQCGMKVFPKELKDFEGKAVSFTKEISDNNMWTNF